MPYVSKNNEKIVMKKILFYILALMSSVCVMAQKAQYDHTVVNAGNTLWKKPLTATFKVTNKDRGELFVKNVDAGCGCLSVSWPHHPLQKGESGLITITYDAKMLGHFDRIVEVYTNVSAEPTQLRIKGNVTNNSNKQSLTDMFPYRIDNILVSTNNIEFPEVHKGDSVHLSIEVYNDGNEVYTPQLMHLPSYITAKYRPMMIARGRRGIIDLTLHSDQLPGLGLNQTSIYVARFAGDKVGTNNDIAVSSILLPDLSELAQGADCPELVISTSALDLGTMGRKSKLKGKVTIANTGTGTLRLSNIQAFNPALNISLPKTELQPGDKTEMSVVVQSKYLKLSKAQPRILLITNDPQHPKQVIDVVWK